jgi:hypothetical protein
MQIQDMIELMKQMKRNGISLVELESEGSRLRLEKSFHAEAPGTRSRPRPKTRAGLPPLPTAPLFSLPFRTASGSPPRSSASTTRLRPRKKTPLSRSGRPSRRA